jgi:ComF family protein
MRKLIKLRFYTELFSHLSGLVFPSTKSLDKIPNSNLYKKNAVYYLYNYRDPKIKELIYEIKFSNNKKVFEHLGKELSSKIYNLVDIENTIILPVPQTNNRRRERGFDVTNNLVKEIKKNIKIKSGYGILKNQRKDVQSKIKNYEERVSSVNKTIRLMSDITDKKFIILDDVFTTGATLNEVKKVIEKNGGKTIACICVAH